MEIARQICSQIGLVICPHQSKGIVFVFHNTFQHIHTRQKPLDTELVPQHELAIVRTGSQSHILLVMDVVPGHSLSLEIWHTDFVFEVVFLLLSTVPILQLVDKCVKAALKTCYVRSHTS
jgi:hypothetical protein